MPDPTPTPTPNTRRLRAALDDLIAASYGVIDRWDDEFEAVNFEVISDLRDTRDAAIKALKAHRASEGEGHE